MLLIDGVEQFSEVSDEKTGELRLKPETQRHVARGSGCGVAAVGGWKGCCDMPGVCRSYSAPSTQGFRA